MPDGLIETLPTLQRLALTYAPGSARTRWLGLLALDTRLAGIVRGSREPMLAQLRLAWWREQFATPIGQAPRGEPLLLMLREWEAQRQSLAGLVDGWEAFAAGSGDPAQGIAELAAARGAAVGALAPMFGAPFMQADAQRMAEGWALVDVAARLADPAEQAAAGRLVAAHDWQSRRLPRAMRPLAVLHGLARGMVQGAGAIDALRPIDMARVLRIGLLGR